MDMVTILSQPEISQHNLKPGHSIGNMDLFFKNLDSMVGMHMDKFFSIEETNNVKVLLENEDIKDMFSISVTVSSRWNRQPCALQASPACTPDSLLGTYLHEGRAETSRKCPRIHFP